MAQTAKDARREVSVLVVTYHPDLQKLRQTLLSILRQADVRPEIIVADDGSEDNLSAQITSLFQERAFADYRLVMNPVNQGTVANCVSGLSVATGRYVKIISPGDFFCGERVLRDWLDELAARGAKWSFSDTVCYRQDGEEEAQVPAPRAPVWQEPYERRDEAKIRWNYVVLEDVAPGAAMLSDTQLTLRYLRRLQAAGIRYAEDFMYRLMMYDGVIGAYWPKPTVFYEYAAGISSGKDSVWVQRLFNEFLLLRKIICGQKAAEPFQRRMRRVVCWKKNRPMIYLVPGMLRRIKASQRSIGLYPFDFAASESWRKSCR